ncbi:hypothetical protein BB558_002828 [Smittium angustum]|uniref:Zn(2)-C6 fungal-type domain-containing protein n=1 Tax=Smittium angustum TaxID=133377 RepID=A0A2U1J7Z6_SMIAN|nr:hypothetical protein BB558_002828 [Smittium angustum]
MKEISNPSNSQSQNPDPTQDLALKDRPKKTSRACFSCQKAHLTCGNERPCQRCIKKGIADSCKDGRRKVAKYLLVDSKSNTSTEPRISATPHETQNLSLEAPEDFNNFDFNTNYKHSNQTRADKNSSKTMSLYKILETISFNENLYLNQLHNKTNSETNSSLNSDSEPGISYSNNLHLNYNNTNELSGSITENDIAISDIQIPQSLFSFPDAYKPPDFQSCNDSWGFKRLLYLVSRMSEARSFKILSAVEQFLPTILSFMSSISNKDLLFAEQSYQKKLHEYDKLLHLTGTPTAIWRRSGEIILVGNEFLYLTLWKSEQLINQRKLIFEIMDDNSVAEYWEHFSSFSFQSYNEPVFLPCTLYRADGSTISCMFCFNIKRDVYDLPSEIIGSFLPAFR